MQHPAPPGTVVRDTLTHPRFTSRPDLVIAYLALHATQGEAGALDLDAAKAAALTLLAAEGVGAGPAPRRPATART